MIVTSRRVLMVIAPKDFNDDEYFIPKKLFLEAGFEVATTSLEKTAVSKNGQKQEVDFLLEDAEPNFDVIVFAGGSGSTIYYDNEKAHVLARQFHEQDKLVAAICAAPGILAHAGLLKGRKATIHPNHLKNFVVNGVENTGNDVEEDGNIITANGPEAAEEFAKRIVKRLS
jgi:protease I